MRNEIDSEGIAPWLIFALSAITVVLSGYYLIDYEKGFSAGSIAGQRYGYRKQNLEVGTLQPLTIQWSDSPRILFLCLLLLMLAASLQIYYRCKKSPSSLIIVTDETAERHAKIIKNLNNTLQQLRLSMPTEQKKAVTDSPVYCAIDSEVLLTHPVRCSLETSLKKLVNLTTAEKYYRNPTTTQTLLDHVLIEGRVITLTVAVKEQVKIIAYLEKKIAQCRQQAPKEIPHETGHHNPQRSTVSYKPS